ncbi:MAG: glycosyltransferase family 2 protein [Bacteroidales bacterium]|nr:glycosyltransferase family 2 protein [Bacteroidales bacterium]
MTISAVIITKNEERNIGRCLASLKGVADEIIVVDSGSTDGTEALCREAGARFEYHAWSGYSEQKNYADSLATGDWTLSIDADEALSPELRESLTVLKRDGEKADAVYSVKRLTNYCGHWVHHCGWYPDSRIRLWPTGQASWDGIIHEELVFKLPLKTLQLEGDLYHYSYYTVAEHVERIARYAPLSAEKDHARGKRVTKAGIVFRPLWTFIRGYLLKGGILDGHTGFVICKLSATYTLVKYSTLYNLNSKDLKTKN